MSRISSTIDLMKKIKQFENAFPDGLKSIKINEDFSIDVDGSVNFFSWRLKEIPFQFKNVTGRFWCNNNELTSLKGSPERIGDFLVAETIILLLLNMRPNMLVGILVAIIVQY